MSVMATDLTVSATGAILTPELEGYNLAALNWIELVNASAFAMSAQFGSLIFQIPAWYSYPVNLRNGAGNMLPGIGAPKLTVGAQTIPGTSAVATLHITLYLVGETPANTQPGPLGGSPIDLSIATSILNTGNPAGNNLIYSQVLMESGIASVSLSNDGFLAMGNALHPGEIQVSDALGNVSQMFGNQIICGAGSPRVIIQKSLFQMLSAAGATDIDMEPGAVHLAGSVSGTIDCYQYLRGTIKRCLIVMNNYRSAGAQTIALPVAYTIGAIIKTGGVGTSGDGGVQLVKASVAQNINIQTTTAAAGGATAGQTTIFNWSMGENITGFDSVAFPLDTSAHTGFVWIEGQ